MTQDLIVSISGLRGIVGENLTPVTAVKYAQAFGTFLKGAKGKQKLKIVLGTDSRVSGDMLKTAVCSGLCAMGIDIIDIGMVTTPTVGIMITELAADGGVVITASHNTIEYNGIKLLTSKGIAPPATMAARIKDIFLEDQPVQSVSSVDCGRITIDFSGDSIHLKKVLNVIDRKTISQHGFKVAIDSANGAGARAAKKLLSAMRCRIVAINDDMSGIFAHKPEPTEENLTELCDKVVKIAADIGVAQDPDADRLAIVDENGRYIGEEYTLALAAMLAFRHNRGKAAANLSTSRMLDDIAAAVGCEVIRTPVGEANVAQAMNKNKCIIGGEGNGGVINPQVGMIRDSLISIAMVLQLCCETGKTVSQLVESIPKYRMTKQKIEVSAEQGQKIIEQAKKTFKKAEVNPSDGCRFDFDDGWLHLRMSNTEPIMRIISEFKDEKTEKKYIDKIIKLQQKILKTK